MTRSIFQRLLFSAIRFVIIAVVILLLIEFSFCGLGDSGKHVWQVSSYALNEGVEAGYDGYWLLLGERSLASFRVLVIVAVSVLIIGYGWGFFGARYRRYRLGVILRIPFSAVAMIPGFWLVILMAIYSYSVWQRPGFADEVEVTAGPDLLSWWHAVIVAIPLIAAGSASLMKTVLNTISSEMSKSYTHGLFIGGHRSESIFYDHIAKGAAPLLIRAVDRPLPLVFGLLIGVEFAFRYRGMGSLLVESVNAASYGGILISALWIVGLISFINWLRDCAIQLHPGEVTDG